MKNFGKLKIKNDSSKINKNKILLKSNKINTQFLKLTKLVKDKEEGFINSQSTRDQKISVDTKPTVDPWDDCVQFNDAESSGVKEEKNSKISKTRLSNSNMKSLHKSVKQKIQIDSKTSYFLNQHLGESYYSLEEENKNEGFEILSPLKEIFSAEEMSVLSSNYIYSELSAEDLSPKNKIKLHRKISSILKNPNKGLSNKFSLNISLINDSELFEDEEKEVKPKKILNYNDKNNYEFDGSVIEKYLLNDFYSEDSDPNDIDEFSTPQIKNEVYSMKIHSNNLKSHLDIINLNYLLRYIFHRSEILSEV